MLFVRHMCRKEGNVVKLPFQKRYVSLMHSEVYVPTAVWQQRCLRVLQAARRQRLKLRFRDNKLATGLVCGRFGAVPSEQV